MGTIFGHGPMWLWAIMPDFKAASGQKRAWECPLNITNIGHQKNFPTVTICGTSPEINNNSVRWNLTLLNQCGIDEYEI